MNWWRWWSVARGGGRGRVFWLEDGVCHVCCFGKAAKPDSGIHLLAFLIFAALREHQLYGAAIVLCDIRIEHHTKGRRLVKKKKLNCSD